MEIGNLDWLRNDRAPVRFRLIDHDRVITMLLSRRRCAS
jgi:hypothetical protein